MNLVIQHSIWAMNASRMLGINDRKITKSGEKLSSGYKINRAADDAAGLSISEKMRKKIRGLEQGMENVEDGISLCQVADGALNEVTDLFQRARELTIKAYNGTNSKDDRQIIQDEIEQCLKEADRIFETTKFNEIPVFHNGQEVHGTYIDTTSYTVSVHHEVYKEIPSWLKINDMPVSSSFDFKIEQHPTYTGITQDLTSIMKQDFKLSNGSYVSLYFGPDKGGDVGGYQWIGKFIKENPTSELLQLGGGLHDYIFATDAGGNYIHIDNNIDMNYNGWTPTVTDNVSLKLDFSGLVGKTDAKDLYNTLSELVGTELAFPCGTCARTEAIRFGGEYIGVGNVKFYDQGTYWAKSDLDLSSKSFLWDGKTYNGYFDAIADVMAMDAADPNKAIKTLALSDEIAKDLAESTYRILNHEMTSHFDRVTQDAADPYSVYVYDYRDIDVVEPKVSMSGFRKHSYISYDTIETVTTEREIPYHRWDEGQIWIQASDNTPDGMFIKSGYLSLKKLGLERYTVNDYRYEVTMRDPEGYAKRLDEWVKAAPDPEPIMVTKKVPVPVLVEAPQYDSIYKDGEAKVVLTKPGVYGEKMVDMQIMEYNYPNDTRGPKPVPDYDVTEIYTPTDLSILDDALTEINRVRSYYGASQNRLEHTYKNNNNVHENLTYAESRIRDTDMADEMVNHSMLNILQQAGLSMLSQANQAGQGVLGLLQ